MSSPGYVWSDAEVREALGLRPDSSRDVEYTGVTTDSRAAGEGDLYVALVGERFDGHEFVADALAAGARGAVVSRSVAGADRTILYPVDDTLAALGRLALHRRRRLTVPVVGVTGSSGKTTTKELLAGALGSTLRVHATKGNLNNQIGLPTTLLRTPLDAEVVVAEMGTNEPGEIAILTAIGEPDVSVLTTVGESHLEKLGSVEGVLKEKLDILRGLRPGGRGVVGDQPRALPMAAREVRPDVRVAGWTDLADEDLRPVDARADEEGRYTFVWRDARVSLRMPGRHAVQNALLALAVAEILGVPAEAAARGVGAVEAGSMRGEVRRLGGLTLLLDCYNANPQSVRASLETLEGRRGRKVAVLGSMLELGASSGKLHADVLRDALGRKLDAVVATGAFARAAAGAVPEREGAGPELIAAEEPDEAYRLLRPRLAGDEVVLLKASRGVALERLVPLLEEDFGAAASADATTDGEA